MHSILKNGRDAAKKNFVPGLLLQGLALLLVLLYYFHAPTQQILLKIPEIKQKAGFLFPILATAFFGGLIPFLFMVVRKDIPRGQYTANLLFLLGFWGCNGLIIDGFYQAQAVLFGDQPDAATVVKKVLFDQFVFNPVWAAPWTMLAMHWKNCGFSFRIAGRQFSRALFIRNTLSILLATWAVWLPTVALVYSLPLALQFPLVNIVLCFWSLLLTALSTKTKQGTS
jgi:hypothetical protein